MLKGINKQIIEIKCPNNECFEKILLFVNPNGKGIPLDVLNKKSLDFYNTILSNFRKKPIFKRKSFVLFIAAAILLILSSFIFLFIAI